MAGRKGNFSSLYCSFCGKSQDEVRKLIAGPTVYICDECIELCNEIIAEEYEKEELGRARSKVPTPGEIKKALGRVRDWPGAGKEDPFRRGS